MAERLPTEGEHTLLCLLAAGEEFTRAVSRFEGNEGLRHGFQCTLNGWVDRGQITAAGRTLALKPCKTNKFIITILGRDRAE